MSRSGSMTAKARWVARCAHAGQDDADGPHLDHVEAVAARVPPGDAQIVAWLHDTIEDSDITAEYLRDTCGFPEHVVDAVVLVTKRKGEPAVAYLSRILMADGEPGRLARLVKEADASHNRERCQRDGNGPREGYYLGVERAMREERVRRKEAA